MDHGGHGGHDMLPRCSMNMLWNTQIVDTCIVFRSWHIRSNAQFVVSFLVLVILGVLCEYLRLWRHEVDGWIWKKLNKGRRAASPPASGRSTPERGETVGLLNGRKPRLAGASMPARFRALRAVLYGASVFLSCFLMLVFMTYNAYLILAVVAGGVIGHFLFSGSIESDDKGMACH